MRHPTLRVIRHAEPAQRQLVPGIVIADTLQPIVRRVVPTRRHWRQRLWSQIRGCAYPPVAIHIVGDALRPTGPSRLAHPAKAIQGVIRVTLGPRLRGRSHRLNSQVPVVVVAGVSLGAAVEEAQLQVGGSTPHSRHLTRLHATVVVPRLHHAVTHRHAG